MSRNSPSDSAIAAAAQNRPTSAAQDDERLHYLRVAEMAADVVGEGDNNGVTTWVSPSVRDVLGFEPEEIIGTAFSELVHPDDLGQLRSGQEQLLRGTKAPFILRIRTKDGSYRTMSIHTRAMKDAAGNVIGRVGGWRDITDQVNAEAELAAERQRTEAALRTMLDPYVLLDAVRNESGVVVDMVYRLVNDAACRYLQRSREELVGTALSQALSGPGAATISSWCHGVVESGEPLVLDDAVLDSPTGRGCRGTSTSEPSEWVRSRWGSPGATSPRGTRTSGHWPSPRPASGCWRRTVPTWS